MDEGRAAGAGRVAGGSGRQESARQRERWRIENQQNWVLDVQFGEDAHRARKNHSATNLGLIRRMALNLLRHNDTTSTLSMRRRKMRACTNLAYRRQILFGVVAA